MFEKKKKVGRQKLPDREERTRIKYDVAGTQRIKKSQRHAKIKTEREKQRRKKRNERAMKKIWSLFDFYFLTENFLAKLHAQTARTTAAAAAAVVGHIDLVDILAHRKLCTKPCA